MVEISKLSETECAQLIDHVMNLARPDHAATVEPEGIPTDEQVAAIRTKLKREQTAACVGQTSRASFECALRATSVEALKACP